MMTGANVTCGYRVEGRVQGVGFRWWTRRTAMELGLDGWVRNEPDGGVVVHVRGGPEVVAGFETALRRGPSGARVDRVTSVPPQGTIVVGEFKIEK